ncbi:MAG: cadherin-like beta sandwich domain-containing protein [Clostridiales bacterium]|nr:cadherin-like beta sandwich domain-containing protein [Clostridiales bacterium]
MIRHKDKTLISFAALVLIVAVVSTLYISRVSAASAVTVQLRADSTPIDPGATVTVDVTVDMFPNLTRLGPIEIQFDSSGVSFAGLERGPDLPSTFVIEHSSSTGVIAVSGIDETVEAQILANQTAPTVDLDGNPISPPADPSMNRNELTVLFRIYFEVLESSKSELRFWISNAAGFRNSAFESVTVHTGSPASVPVNILVSSDASLSSLEIEGTTLAPDFSPGIFKYNASVPRSVTDLVVDFVPGSRSSQVFVTGQTGLAVGDNILKVSVLAQDLKTTLEYTVVVTREKSFVPPGATVTDSFGVTYKFEDFSDTLSIPPDFYQSEILLENRIVPAFRMDGMKDVLLYLSGPSGEPGLHVYSPASNTVLAFDAQNVFFRLSQLLTVVPLPAGVPLPEGFSPAVISFRGQSVQGYVSEDGRVKIFYMQDDSGKSRFYTVDAKNNDVYPYCAVKKSDSPLFLTLFIIFLVLSVAEAAMLALVIFQVRKRRPRTPKVRRV